MSKNPFNPSFGKIPTVFIDRDETTRLLIEELTNQDGPYQTTMISGVRGVGKTALLTDVCNEMRRDSKWIVADIPSNGDILETLVQYIHARSSSDLKKAIESIEGFSVSILGTGVSYSTRNAGVNYQLILEEILEKLQKKKMHLLVAIDEVTATKSIKLFASIYQILIRKGLPISLVMTGLPRNISELRNDKVLTFLLRSARVELPLLNKINVSYSYKETFAKENIQVSPEVLNRMTALTNGYSYAFQLLGYLLWERNVREITPKVIDSVMDKYKENLFRNAYFKIYEELSSVDRDFLKAMATIDHASEKSSIAMKEVSGQMGKHPGYTSTYRRRLLNAGLIQVDSYGHIAFALPLFGDYIREFHGE